MSFKTKIDIHPLENYIIAPNLVNSDEDDAIAAHQNLMGGRKRGLNQVGGVVMARPHPKQVQKFMKTPREKLFSLRKRCMDGHRVESVEAVLMVHQHRQPHVVLLKQSLSRAPLAHGGGGDGSRTVIPSSATNNSEYTYRLPGGRCRQGEKPEDCLLRKLWKHLLNDEQKPGAPGGSGSMHSADTIVDVVPSSAALGSGGGGNSQYFRIGEVLGKWYRPHLNPLMYPYVPPHLTQDVIKEIRTMFLVHMDRSFELQIPYANVELVAVPLFDLYDNTAKYSPDITSIPILLSRVFINSCSNIDF